LLSQDIAARLKSLRQTAQKTLFMPYGIALRELDDVP
jgi:hypothetical protein